jgi:hypothetical protein
MIFSGGFDGGRPLDAERIWFRGGEDEHRRNDEDDDKDDFLEHGAPL